jgi:hypothetical protein
LYIYTSLSDCVRTPKVKKKRAQRRRETKKTYPSRDIKHFDLAGSYPLSMKRVGPLLVLRESEKSRRLAVPTEEPVGNGAAFLGRKSGNAVGYES